MTNIPHIFEGQGGRFITSPKIMIEKIRKIKAFVFDWDGVFNDGLKSENGSSLFNELDAMGTNLVRFGAWYSQNRMPQILIISGERNPQAIQLVKRDHFDAFYFKIRYKIDALNHFMEQHNLKPDEIAFFFDDALDLSVAEVCGLRIMIQHKGNPLFQKYVIDRGLADYVTGSVGGQHAIREGCELILGLSGLYDTVIDKRREFYPEFNQYFLERSQVKNKFYTFQNNQIEEVEI